MCPVRSLTYVSGRSQVRTCLSREFAFLRNIDRNWELLAPFAGAQATVPALYIAGDCDPVVSFPGLDRLIPNLSNFVPAIHARRSRCPVVATGPAKNWEVNVRGAWATPTQSPGGLVHLIKSVARGNPARTRGI
jgi:hypothetical protein